MAKNRTRTDWQIDLKPVARATPPDRAASANGHGSYPGGTALPAAAPEPTPAVASPALFKALGELRATDEALLDGLGEIRVVMHGMRASIDELAVRMAAIEAMLVSPQPTGPARPVRETSRTLRDSTTVPLERRSRRASAPNPAEGTAQ